MVSEFFESGISTKAAGLVRADALAQLVVVVLDLRATLGSDYHECVSANRPLS